MIEATVICDSISPQGHRLTTFKLVYPKFIHGEAKTHRLLRVTNEGGIETTHELWQEVGLMDDPNLSRNASSSRAIPVHKLIAEVRDDATRAGPVVWASEQRGMQGGAELPELEQMDGYQRLTRNIAKDYWADAAFDAARHAERMVKLGVHKSIVNRLLEPFSHIRVVVSATEYANFFGLRLDKAAQPEMRTLAEAMWRAYGESKPRPLQPGQWHLPFVRGRNDEEAEAMMDQLLPPGNAFGLNPHEQMIRVSVARCARVSYESFETGKRSTVEEDLKLYDRLLGAQPLHASPAEHQATPDEWLQSSDYRSQRFSPWRFPTQHGNFVGWRQYRKLLPGESCAPLPEGYHANIQNSSTKA